VRTNTLPWWEWRPAIDRLFTWGRALLRGRRYRILLNIRDPHLGWEHADSQTICLNPVKVADLIPNWDAPYNRSAVWNGARAVLAHEVGHARYSGRYPDEALLTNLVNVLEDERIERTMAITNGVLKPLFDELGTAVWRTNSATDDSAWGVLSACLLWRWEHDHPELDSLIRLSGQRQALWEDAVCPRVERAWEAETTAEVAALAGEILDALGLDPDTRAPDWVLPAADTRGSDQASPAPDNLGGPISLPDGDPDLDPPGQPSNPPLPLGSYLDLEAEVRVPADRLAAQLKVDPEPERWDVVEYGGRYSFRQECRTPDTPNRMLIQRPDPRLALGVLVDRSTSMNDYGLMRGVRRAVMMLLLACEQLPQVALEITVFERDERVLPFNGDPEHAKPMIGGLSAAGTTAMYEPLRGVIARTDQRPEGRKAVLVIHDGEPNQDQWDDCRAEIAVATVPVWGLFVSDQTQPQLEANLEQLFAGKVLCGSTDLLAEQLANVLKALHAYA
jgi:hypothetical protein